VTTQDHVVAVAGMVRVSWGWLKAALEPGNARRVNQRALTPASVARRNERATQERADRPHLAGGGKLVAGNVHAGASVSAIDARSHIAAEVDDIASEMTLRVSTVRNIRAYRPDATNVDTRFTGALDWVSRNVQHVTDPPILNSAYNRLTGCDRLASATAGAVHQRQPLASECPACGQRSLAWGEPTPDEREASVRCLNPACRCRGVACECGLPGRLPDMAHVWIQARWEMLAAKLKEAR
jgi:hypothetical protein